MKLVKQDTICAFLSILFILAVLGGCMQRPESKKLNGTATDGTAKNVTETSSTSHDSAISQTFTFQINASMPVYKCTAAVSGDEQEQTTKIEITDADTGTLIQSIVLPSNEVFTKSAVYFKDVTFSGNLALIIPLERAAHFVTFDAYIWNTVKKQFIEAPSFQDIYNPSIDTAGKQILSKDSSSQTTSYAMFSFRDNQFILTNSVYWEPAESDAVSNADSLVHFVEAKGASQTTVNDFYVPGDNSYAINTNNSCVKPYFISGSFWDLSSQKWQCTFYNEVKLS